MKYDVQYDKYVYYKYSLSSKSCYEYRRNRRQKSTDQGQERNIGGGIEKLILKELPLRLFWSM